jgi:outer membrane protein TolC
MNKLFHIISILSLMIISFNNVQAQTSEFEDSSLNDRRFQFPPLQAIIDSVIKRSAMVAFRSNNVLSKEATLATERVHWSRNMGIAADTRYGNLSNFATSEDGLTNSQALTTARQFTYSVGIFLKFPLFDAINRKHQIKLATAEVDAAKSMAESQKEEIRQTIIRMYQNLILKEKLLQIRSRMLGDGRVNKQMVEKEFRNGIVPLSEYVRISGMTTNMEAAYETAMSEFITAKQLLEDMAGFVFELKLSN